MENIDFKIAHFLDELIEPENRWKYFKDALEKLANRTLSWICLISETEIGIDLGWVEYIEHIVFTRDQISSLLAYLNTSDYYECFYDENKHCIKVAFSTIYTGKSPIISSESGLTNSITKWKRPTFKELKVTGRI